MTTYELECIVNALRNSDPVNGESPQACQDHATALQMAEDALTKRRGMETLAWGSTV